MDKKKLVNCVNKLFDQAKMHDAFASVTSNDRRAIYESEISAEILKIAQDLDKMVYEEEMAEKIIIVWRATQNDPFIHTDNLGLVCGYETREHAKEEAEKIMGVNGNPNLHFDYRIFELVTQRRFKTLDRQKLIDYRDQLLNRAKSLGNITLTDCEEQKIIHGSNVSREVRKIAHELGKIVSEE